MSCNHCGTKFNFFHKEKGCANCGLSLCSKCLQQKCNIPYKGHGEFNVCRVCYLKLKNGPDNSVNEYAPPDRFVKRLENLENPAAPPITVYREDPKVTALKSGLSSTDRELVDRLEKLKEKQHLPPSDSEIRERLAKLKGDSFRGIPEVANKPLYTPDTRTNEEKVGSLLEQYASEQGIDTSHQSQDDLAQRLANLKGQEYKENRIDAINADSDSEEEVDRITKKIKAEVSLEERCPIGSSRMATGDDDNDEDIRSSSPELPWCVLCNSDATVKCYDCDGDLYCNSCNVEVHTNYADSDHRVVPYKQK